MSSGILTTVDHRPYPLPAGRWRMAQRWNDLLFAHWPVFADQLASLLPPALEPDLFDGAAWIGVVPFWMEQVRTRTAVGITIAIPGTGSFSELNLRTYVRSRATNLPGVYFFSLDAASPLAVLGARLLFRLPYFWATMSRESLPDGTIAYRSRRLLTRRSVRFQAEYRGLGIVTPSVRGSLEHFLTERYSLFTAHGRVGHIHHLPWPLEAAEAEIALNELPAAHGVSLPTRPPILHFARSLEVFIWALRQDDTAGITVDV